VLAELEKRIESRLRKRKEERKEVGALSAVVAGGQVRIRGGTRKIVYTPPAPELISQEFPSAVRGDVNIDSILLSYVRAIRFEKVEDSEVQVGEITFSFRGG